MAAIHELRQHATAVVSHAPSGSTQQVRRAGLSLTNCNGTWCAAAPAVSNKRVPTLARIEILQSSSSVSGYSL